MNRRFPKRTRLAKREEISLVRHTGRAWRCPLFVVYSRANNASSNRFAILVGRRTGIAAIRNKVKRRFRQIFRTNDWKKSPFFDILIIPQPGSTEKYQALNSRYEEWIKSIPE